MTPVALDALNPQGRTGSFMPGNPYFRLSTTLREAGLRPSTCLRQSLQVGTRRVRRQALR
ncbi:hypothetical protein QUB80_30550 [Chlorogloeopsis sp. ULAP01]|uniref:hypothetical protein n=1 Tax=Chlorogloeopsis sp. ULAP01 TaxID=3056483 RepID=UPI0025AAC25D|nr:hypothetical protein [Chlorogloeopsis sp. ULAP01]MDM9385001.1 hypothetical protein [Chlorogloeopsis sp. ULAP01]